MTPREIMIYAHKIARTLEGDYAARLSEGLKQAWRKKSLISKWQYIFDNCNEDSRLLDLERAFVVDTPKMLSKGGGNTFCNENMKDGKWCKGCPLSTEILGSYKCCAERLVLNVRMSKENVRKMLVRVKTL